MHSVSRLYSSPASEYTWFSVVSHSWSSLCHKAWDDTFSPSSFLVSGLEVIIMAIKFILAFAHFGTMLLCISNPLQSFRRERRGYTSLGILVVLGLVLIACDLLILPNNSKVGVPIPFTLCCVAL